MSSAAGNQSFPLCDRALAIKNSTRFFCPVVRREGGPACEARDPRVVKQLKLPYLGLRNVEVCGECYKWIKRNVSNPESMAFKDCAIPAVEYAPSSWHEYADWIKKQPERELAAHGAEVAKLLAEHLPKGERPAWAHIAPHLPAGGDIMVAKREEHPLIRVALNKLADAKWEWDEKMRKEEEREEQG